MSDPIADSIDAVLSSVGPDDGLTYDAFAPHADKSVELQRLINQHVARFEAGMSSIPARIQLIVLHCFWLGFESGKQVAYAEKMEEMFK